MGKCARCATGLVARGLVGAGDARRARAGRLGRPGAGPHARIPARRRGPGAFRASELALARAAVVARRSPKASGSWPAARCGRAARGRRRAPVDAGGRCATRPVPPRRGGEPRRRVPSRVPVARRGVLPVQRRGGGHPRAAARRRHHACGGCRRGRPPGKRHRLHLRRAIRRCSRSRSTRSTTTRTVEAARLAGRRPARRHRRPRVPAGAGARAARGAWPARPDLIVYVAGADPFLEDQLGGLCLTFEGLRGRDFLVLLAARDAGHSRRDRLRRGLRPARRGHRGHPPRDDRRGRPGWAA
ncbi:MAG: hypothetical protein M0C28_13350 [Candidatus Moduliflexus flocculans]|nr:hypothetical protein [Candidatus Moduliflexus flocculans]